MSEEFDDLKRRIERIERMWERVEPGALARADAWSALDEMRPGWKKIVGNHGDNNPFRRWLGKQPEELRELIETTDDPNVVEDCLKRFDLSGRALQ